MVNVAELPDAMRQVQIAKARDRTTTRSPERELSISATLLATSRGKKWVGQSVGVVATGVSTIPALLFTDWDPESHEVSKAK